MFIVDIIIITLSVACTPTLIVNPALCGFFFCIFSVFSVTLPFIMALFIFFSVSFKMLPVLSFEILPLSNLVSKSFYDSIQTLLAVFTPITLRPLLINSSNPPGFKFREIGYQNEYTSCSSYLLFFYLSKITTSLHVQLIVLCVFFYLYNFYLDQDFKNALR